MPIEFNCNSCSKLLRVPDGTGGKQCLCPGCSTTLTIPLQQPNQTSIESPPHDGGADIALCIPCPKCKHELICDPSLVGTKGQCRSCMHIFVISDLPTNDAQSLQPVISWVFSCPKCNQLFEGSEEMRGKRGKCHACGEVFSIELRIANGKTDEDSNASAIEKPRDRTQSFDNFDGDLTLDMVPEEPQRKPAPKQATSSGTVVSRASPDDRAPIQFNCLSCKGRLEVPGAAARQLTHCPHCKRQLTVPSESEPTQETLAANDPWANLSPLGSAPAPMPQSNPFGDTLYPPPMAMSSMSSGARRRRGGNGGVYITCGVFIAICALLGIALEVFYIVAGTVAMMRPNVDHTVASIQVFVVAVMFILSLIQLVGGISLARRSSLAMARTAAIICCLPCLCVVLNIPFGIWGCVLTFGSDAEREFR